uniref:Uncharacterized protein n=1 Tax=Oryzias sinensis TaxID=183150 RepID=A0A8C7ZIA0_9TELE
MAARRLTCLGLNAVYSTVCSPNQALKSCWGAVEQMRSYYVDWRMLRDVKRRQMAFDYADERLRINALRKNTILPKELQVGSSFLFLIVPHHMFDCMLLLVKAVVPKLGGAPVEFRNKGFVCLCQWGGGARKYSNLQKGGPCRKCLGTTELKSHDFTKVLVAHTIRPGR